VLIDTRDLPLAVEFQKELLGFIRQADTVVYVLSPDSIGSPWVVWEIEQVEALSKRLAPVVARDVQNDAVPEGICKINYVFFTGANAEGARFEAQADALASALKTDLEWIKAHTRWGERARLWHEQGKRSAQLLRGHELGQAETWSARQPLEAPPLTPLQREYIAASRKSATRRQRYWIAGSALVSVLMAGLAIVAYAQRIAADASAAEARRTLALADQRKAAELSTATKSADLATQKPGRALAYLARAIRNDPANSGIGRRALYLMAEHPHLRPIPLANSSLLSFAAPRAAFVDIGIGASGPTELTSPDGRWALSLAEGPVRIRKAGEQTFVPLSEEEGFGTAYRGAAFPDHSRYAAVAGGSWGEYGGLAEIRIVSDSGAVLGKHSVNDEIVGGLGLSPDGRLLFVSRFSSDRRQPRR
jgi:TIR domain